jgi:hypothetical protein
LARFQLPNIIHIQLLTPEGVPFTQIPVPLMIKYGYQLPPLWTNSSGQLRVKRKMFSKAEHDEISTGLMDHRGTYELNRYIQCRVLSQADARAAAEARVGSGWPILSFEKELYGDLTTLFDAYIPTKSISPVDSTIDLAEGRDVVRLALTIKTISKED